MNKLTWILVFLFSAAIASSQEDSLNMQLPKYAIGISPTSLLNVNEGIQISQDVRLWKNGAFSLESAYIYSTAHVDRKTRGFRLRPGVEFTLIARPQNMFSMGFFFLYRKIIEDFKFSISYPERYKKSIPVIREKILLGSGMNLNWRFLMSENIFIDLGFGFGLGKHTVEDESSEPFVRRNFLFFDWSRYDTVGTIQAPITFFNFNVSYVLIN